MKKMIVGVALVACSLSVCAQAQAKKQRVKLTDEQKQELIMMKVGGFVVQPIKSTRVRIYNLQSAVPAAAFDKVVVNMQKGPNFPADVVTTKWTPGQGKEDGVGFAIIVHNDPSDPCKMSCAPDDGWVKVNVAPFLQDKPSQELLEKRVLRELWRGAAFALGAGTTQNPMCPLKPAASLKELDGLSGVVPCPEVLGLMQKWGQHWGINKYRKTTYRKACQEGWAPAPTNEYQKAIWKEVHELPTKPLGLKVQK